MIDLRSERLVVFGEAAKLLPRRRGRAVHAATLYRYHKHGVRCGSGRVYLEAVRTPGGLATTAESVARFIARLNEAGTVQTMAAQLDSGVDAAVQELIDDGG